MLCIALIYIKKSFAHVLIDGMNCKMFLIKKITKEHLETK